MHSVKLGDTCSRLSSGDSIKASSITDIGKYPVFGGNGLRGYTDKANFKGSCAVIGRQGANCGSVHYFAGEAFMSEHAVVAVANEDNNSRYLAALFSLLDLGRFSGQSAQPGISVETIKQVPLVIHDKNSQDAIAELLITLDDSIDVNQKICRELESTAQLVFDYWFTQFDFPDKNGNPYRSSAGKMTYSEELKREIPEEWSVRSLGESCRIKLGGTPDTSCPDYWNGDIPWLSSAEVANFPVLESEQYITVQGREHSATEYSPVGSVVLSITRYLRPSILGVDSCFNQSVVSLEENETLKKEFIYPLIKSQIPRYMMLRTGAQQPHINKDTVKTTLFACPTKEVLQAYYSLVSPLYDAIISKSKEALRLKSLRDWLLPMLMSGQVIIGEE